MQMGIGVCESENQCEGLFELLEMMVLRRPVSEFSRSEAMALGVFGLSFLVLFVFWCDTFTFGKLGDVVTRSHRRPKLRVNI